MIEFAKKYAKNVHSQNGEDGIIEELINRIQPTELTAVEFGCPDYYFVPIRPTWLKRDGK